MRFDANRQFVTLETKRNLGRVSSRSGLWEALLRTIRLLISCFVPRNDPTSDCRTRLATAFISFLKVVAKADTMLRTQMFPCSLPRAIFVVNTKFVSEIQQVLLISFRNILCPQQMLPGLRSMETKHFICFPRVCPPKKHHKQQCVLVCHCLKAGGEF